MLSDPLAEQKQHLREKLRFRRRHFATNLDALARLTAFRVLPAPLAALAARAGAVAIYTASRFEPDILPMFTDITLALPHHRGRIETMDFRRWHVGDRLVEGPWGTLQPADEAEDLLPALILCPLVGFDRHGGRLGQGGGHYDRFFAAHPEIPRIGVAWSVQEVDTVPIESTDAKLDAVLTEQEYIVTGDRL